jgi:chemotaxis signal transduction protein
LLSKTFRKPLPGKESAALKPRSQTVDTLYSMVRLTLMDGSLLEIQREEALEILPYGHVFSGPMLKDPIEGLFIYRGKVIPVLGPLPKSVDLTVPAEERPWILLLKGCAQVIRGMPEFEEAAPSNVIPLTNGSGEESSDLLEELDLLLKSA